MGEEIGKISCKCLPRQIRTELSIVLHKQTKTKCTYFTCVRMFVVLENELNATCKI